MDHPEIEKPEFEKLESEKASEQPAEVLTDSVDHAGISWSELAAEPAEAKTEEPIDPKGFDGFEDVALAQAEILEENEEEEKALEKIPLTEERKEFLTASLETLLFMSNKPVTLPKLRSLIDKSVSLSAYREMINQLKDEFSKNHRGIEIAELSMGFQLRTKPHMAAVLRNLVKTVPLKLTPAMMEVMAIVAYKQPVTKDDLDQVRGVDCSYLIRSLMEKKLLKITGRSELPGRPMLFGTTHEFLELFNLKDTTQLPPLHEIESMVAQSEVGDVNEETDQLNAFGQMVDESLNMKLFDDTGMDQELEEIKATIESISTSTDFIDEQKAKEREAKKLAAQAPVLEVSNTDIVPENKLELVNGTPEGFNDSSLVTGENA